MTLPPPPPDPTTRVEAGPMVGDPIADNIVVEAFGVTKAFGDVVAVSDVSFRLGPGLTALLGPNGAGKSTLFRMLCGLTQPSKGNVRVFGKNARRDRNVRGRIGLAPQQDAMFDRLSALEFVTLAAATHGIAGPETAARRSTRPC